MGIEVFGIDELFEREEAEGRREGRRREGRREEREVGRGLGNVF